MIRATARTARKAHTCGCGNAVRRGDRYIEHVASPDHDGITPDAWSRFVECSDCATRYGRSVA